MDENKIKEHETQMQQLKSRFKKSKLKILAIYFGYNILVDVLSILFLSIEIKIFVLIASTIASSMIVIERLNSLDKARAQQEALLMEKRPVSKLRF